MSHEGTNWAIRQKGLKPATKLVLWYLCDRHNPDFGCFPRQDRLAAEAEMSVSSLNDHLRILEERGLIRRIKRSDPKTKQQLSTLYILGFEARFTQGPSPKSGDGQAEIPLPKSGDGESAEDGPQGLDNAGEFDADPVPDFGTGDDEDPTPKTDQKPTPKFGDYSKTVREITSKEEDAGASANPQPFAMTEAGMDELLRIAGHDPDGELPSWWQGQIAADHVARWNRDHGFTEARILSVAREARKGHVQALQGPKGFDAAMKKAAKTAATPVTAKPGTPESMDQLCAFYAEKINGPGWFQTSLQSDIRAELIRRKMVTPERMRERGL